MLDDPHKARIERLRQSLQLDGATKERRATEKRQRKTRVDGRALRATGRTDIFPFRCRPELIERIKKAARKKDVSIAVWMEGVIEAALEGDDDA